MRRDVAICGCLVLLTLTAFWHVGRLEVVSVGDGVDMARNAQVQKGLTADNVRFAFTTFDSGAWQPLTWLSHMLDASLFGPNGSIGPHLVNLALHLANTLLVFLLLRWMTAAPWPSAVVAALFGVHPLHANAVALLAGRKDVLSTLLALLAVAAYVSYTRLPSAWRYVLVLVLMTAGVLVSPLWVVLPGLLLLLDFWPLGRWLPAPAAAAGRRRVRAEPVDPAELARRGGQLLLEKVPLFLVSAAAALVTYWALDESQAMVAVQQAPFGLRFSNGLLSCVGYLGKFLVPVNLAAMYPLERAPDAIRVTGATLLLLALTVAAVAGGWRGRRWLAVGWFWYLGALLPVVGLVRVGDLAMADQYTYAALVGILVAVTWGLARLLPWRAAGYALGGVALVAVLLCVAVTQKLVAYAADSETLYGRAIKVAPGNAPAFNSWGLWLLTQGKAAEAVKQFQRALDADPDYMAASYNQASAQVQLGRARDAIVRLTTAIRIDPDYARTHALLAQLLFQQGRLEESIAQWREVLRIHPDDAAGHSSLAVVLVMQEAEARGNNDFVKAKQKLADAANEAQMAIELNPGSAAAHDINGIIAIHKGHRAEAVREFREAVAANPNNMQLRYNMASLLQGLNRPDLASNEWRDMLRLEPNNPAYAAKLATVLVQQGKWSEAEEVSQGGLALDPGNLWTLRSLGMAAAKQGKWKESLQAWQQVLRQRSENVEAMNAVAWIEATSPDDSLLNPRDAVQLAERASVLTRQQEPQVLDTLAAAYAADKRFKLAVETADKAHDLAMSQRQISLAQDILARKRQYEGNFSYRDAVVPSGVGKVTSGASKLQTP